MSLVANDTITDADVNGLYTTQLGNLVTQRAKLPALTWVTVSFPAVVTGSASAFKTTDIILPDDAIIAEIAVASGEGNGADTVTVDNGAMLEPVSISHTRGAGFLEATRWYATGSNHNTSILLRGSVLTITLSTTNTSTSSNLQVSVGLFSEWRPY